MIARMRSDNDGGFGIAEVLVAMFLLGLIAVAVIPILVQGLRASLSNAAVASATQLANQQLEQVRASPPAAPSRRPIRPAPCRTSRSVPPARSARPVRPPAIPSP